MASIGVWFYLKKIKLNTVCQEFLLLKMAPQKSQRPPLYNVTLSKITVVGSLVEIQQIVLIRYYLFYVNVYIIVKMRKLSAGPLYVCTLVHLYIYIFLVCSTLSTFSASGDSMEGFHVFAT